jgi:hypothetical protein
MDRQAKIQDSAAKIESQFGVSDGNFVNKFYSGDYYLHPCYNFMPPS